jgi:hypothetical protein
MQSTADPPRWDASTAPTSSSARSASRSRRRRRRDHPARGRPSGRRRRGGPQRPARRGRRRLRPHARRDPRRLHLGPRVQRRDRRRLHRLRRRPLANNTHAKLLECVDPRGRCASTRPPPGDRRRQRRHPGLGLARLRRLGRLRRRALFEAPAGDVTVQEFQFQTFITLSPSLLEQVSPPPAGPIANSIFSYSGSGDVTAPVSRAPDAADNEAARPPTSPASPPATSRSSARRLHLRDQGDQRVQRRGLGVVIYNNAARRHQRHLGNDFTLDIGVTSVTQAVGQQLAATPGLVMRVKTDTFRGIATTYNVLAETAGQATRQRRHGRAPTSTR